MDKDIKLSEMAKDFNRTVKDLASFMGYSTQALHKIIICNEGVYTRRFHSSISLLKRESDKIYKEDLKKALDAKERREQYIQRMIENAKTSMF